jgi:hypothetical protein
VHEIWKWPMLNWPRKIYWWHTVFEINRVNGELYFAREVEWISKSEGLYTSLFPIYIFRKRFVVSTMSWCAGMEWAVWRRLACVHSKRNYIELVLWRRNAHEEMVYLS